MPKCKQIPGLEMVLIIMRVCSANALKARGIQSEMFSYNRREQLN